MGSSAVMPQNQNEELSKEWRPRSDEAFGAYIRRIRQMRRLTLPDVARALATLPAGQRVSHPYLSQIELGQVHQPARERLLSIASVLGIPEAWLLEKAGLSSTGASEQPRPERNPLVDQVTMRAAQMEPADLKLFLQMMDSVINMRKAENKTHKI